MLQEVGMATEAAATVLLELTISSEGVEGEGKQPAVDAATLDDHGWASLIQQCSQEDLQFLSFLIPRDLLQQKSTFFQSLLGGNFRESSENHVRVSWDTAAFCSLLQCMCSGKLHISASNMEHLLEGILFFGIESAMAALIEAIRRGNLLKWVPKLWSLAKGMGQQSVADVCVETIAINFEDMIKQSNFQDLPAVLLAACIDHKQLTVSSEKSLCEAVLNWFLCHQNLHKNTMEEVLSCEVHSSELVPVAFEGDHKQLHNKHFSSLDSTILGISRKIRVALLPLEFILGCLFQNCAGSMFLVEASEVSGYDKLLLLIEEAGKKEFAHLLDAESDELTLRITNHSVRIDLAGCQQITMAMLFQAVLRFVRQSGVNDLQSYLEVETEVRKLSCNKGFRSSLKSFDQDWCRALSLKNLCHVNLERCWRVDQDSLVIWLRLVCPNLKLLNISHCPQLQVNILPLISLSCKSLETVNLSLYFNRTPVKPYIGQDAVHVENHTHSRYPENYWQHSSLTCLTRLSLQGRSSLMDWNLVLVARCCPNLSDVNLGGCCQLTDQGISVFLANFSNLTVFQAAYTAFGSLCASALLQKETFSTACPPSRVLQSSHTSDDVPNRIINYCPLTTLDLEGCLGVDQVSVAKLLNKAFFLINLNLGFTVVDDRTILSFEGTSLQKLDLRETQVSEHGLAHIVKWNSNLKVLNIRGCRRAVVPLILADADFSQVADKPLKEDMPKGLALDDLAVGWGFFDSTLKAWKSALYSLQSLSLGVGGRISETALGSLYEVSPLLEYLTLNFQVISDESLLNLLRNVPKLRRIEFHHCLGEISSKFIDVISTNLTCLSLERGVAWMTDADVYLLGGSCKGLTQLSLVGCQFLTSKSLCAMAQMWRGMIKLQLEECGTMTSKGGSCLFVCKALQQLTLRHNGLGLHRNFARRAIFELPLLQDLCLDMCDSTVKGYDTPCERRSLSTLRLARCTTLRNSFNDSTRQWHKDTIIVHWNDIQQKTTIVKEQMF